MEPRLGPRGDGLDVGFDDEATATYALFEATCSNNPAISGIFQPANALSAFDGENPNGTWTISISDDLTGDTGTLNSWSMAVTTFASAPIQSAVQSFNQTTAVPIADVALTTSTIAVSVVGPPSGSTVWRPGSCVPALGVCPAASASSTVFRRSAVRSS